MADGPQRIRSRRTRSGSRFGSRSGPRFENGRRGAGRQRRRRTLAQGLQHFRFENPKYEPVLVEMLPAFATQSLHEFQSAIISRCTANSAILIM
ncbi:unnamed protein product [Nesidiocoris tenuis]|uniref:Uncharacterized protein n=1 Tax=Nesidiocoris tenuis TaxID=355587 RepID=A0A6H5HDA0_9HEMI|nr:unnamed protein product [Nesidiocoris tenuis]